MSNLEERFNKLKKISEDNKIKKERIKGSLDSEKANLKSKGYSSIEEAEQSLANINDEIEEKTTKFEARIKAIENKYAKQLQEYSHRD